MKVMKTLIVAASILFGNFGIVSAGSQVGTIQNLSTRASDGMIYVVLSGTYSGCSSNSTFVVKAETSNAGKTQFAQLLTAYATGKSVWIYGNGNCNGRQFNFEEIETVILNP